MIQTVITGHGQNGIIFNPSRLTTIFLTLQNGHLVNNVLSQVHTSICMTKICWCSLKHMGFWNWSVCNAFKRTSLLPIGDENPLVTGGFLPQIARNSESFSMTSSKRTQKAKTFNFNSRFPKGRSAAKTYDCKYIEVSAAIEHKVDDLLVGILKQIRLIRQREEKTSRASSKHQGKGDDAAGCLTRARQNVLAKLLRSKKFHSKSCDNLYVL